MPYIEQRYIDMLERKSQFLKTREEKLEQLLWAVLSVQSVRVSETSMHAYQRNRHKVRVMFDERTREYILEVYEE